MNIFVTNKNPHLAVRDLDDRRLVKMVLETAQIICTAHIIRNTQQPIPYKATHIKHPCCVWASSDLENLFWLTDYFVEISEEYCYRFNKVHKSYTALRHLPLVDCSILYRYRDKDFDLIFQNCAANTTKGLNFKRIEDTVLAYRLYLAARWELELQSGYQPKFTKRDFPEWYKREVEGVDYVSV